MKLFSVMAVAIGLFGGVTAGYAGTLEPMMIKGGVPVYPPALAKSHPKGEVVNASFFIDYDGFVSDVVVRNASSPEVEAVVTQTLREWKFSQTGQSGTMPIFEARNWPIVIGQPATAHGAYYIYALDRMPVAIREVLPEPSARIRYSTRVDMGFVIDRRGNVQDLTVLGSQYPAGVAAAVAAMLQWKFAPGMKNGVPVLTYEFLSLTSQGKGSSIEWVAPRSPEGAPPEFHYDIGPTPVMTGAVVYPYDLLVKGVRGSATVAFAIDPYGFVQRTTVSEASDPEFAAAAAAAIGTWIFRPAFEFKTKLNRWSVMKIKQDFDPDDKCVALDDSGARLLQELTAGPKPAFPKITELDAFPVLRYQCRPVVPLEVREGRIPAKALVEIIIDRFGHAQLPRIVSTTNQAFGWAAATAMGRWQFTPPMKNGVPVDAIADIPAQYLPPPKKG